MSVNLGKAVAYLELDTSKFTGNLKTAASQLQVFTQSNATVTQKFNAASAALVGVGTTLTKSVTLPLATVGALASKTAMDFESGMSEVKAISGATGADFEALTEKAKEMGAKTKFSATEAASAFKYMAMAGWDADQMLNGIEATMNLAAASGEDLASVSDIVTDALTAFGLKAEDASHFADVLAVASSKSNTNVGLMGATFQYVAPVAGALGYSVEDCAVAIGLMANSGIKGEKAGTQLRSIMSRLVKPTKMTREAMDELDISMTNADGTMKPLNQTMVELREKFAGLTDEQKAQKAAAIGGQEAMAGLLAIVNASETDFQNLTKYMQNTDGACKEMSDTMLDNAKGSLTIMKSSLEGTAITIGDRLLPMVKKAAESITKMSDKFQKLSKTQQDNVVKWGLIAAATPLVITAFGKVLGLLGKLGTGYITLTKTIIPATKALTMMAQGFSATQIAATGLSTSGLNLATTITGIINPCTLAVAAIGGLAIAGYAAAKSHENEVTKAYELTEADRELYEASHTLAESYRSIEEARGKAFATASDEAVRNQQLFAELQSITDANGKVTSGYEARAQVIIGILSEALGQEITMTDGVIQNYQDLCQNIDQVIQKKKQEAIMEAFSEQYQEAVRNQADAYRDYTEALTNNAEKLATLQGLEQQLADAKAQFNKELEETGSTTQETSEKVQDLSAQVGKARDSYEQSTSALNDAKEAYEGYSQTIENYEGVQAAIIEGDQQKIQLALDKLKQGFVTAKTATATTLSEQTQELSKQYDLLCNELASGNENVTQEMVDNVRSMLDQSQKELATKVEENKQSLFKAFNSLGIELTSGLKNALGMMSPELQEQTVALLQSLRNGVGIEAPQLTALFSNLGIDLPQSMIDNIASQEPSIQQKAIDLLTQFQYGEASQRPIVLDQMKELGINIDESWADGMLSNMDTVNQSANTIGVAGNTSAEQGLNYAMLHAPEIDGNKTIVSAQNTGTKANSEAERTLNYMLLHSPSVDDSKTVNSAGQAGTKGNSKANSEITRKNVGSPSVDGSNLYNSAASAASSAWSSMQRILSKTISVGAAVINSVIPKHKDGLDYVPYDNYLAYLHKGERVLTANEAKVYNNGGGRVVSKSDVNNNMVFNFYNTKPEPYEYARQMKRAQQELFNGI